MGAPAITGARQEGQEPELRSMRWACYPGRPFPFADLRVPGCGRGEAATGEARQCGIGVRLAGGDVWVGIDLQHHSRGWPR